MMGGCVLKYFPEELNAFDFNEQEMNRIIACAFSLKDVKNMINTVMKERPDPEAENDGEEVAYDEADSDENETDLSSHALSSLFLSGSFRYEKTLGFSWDSHIR